MKKTFFLTFALLLMAFSAVCAQNTGTAIQELDFTTIGDLFTWGERFVDVYNQLSRYDLIIEADDESEYISAEPVSEEEMYVYGFYFDEKTTELYMIDCFTVLPEDTAPTDALQILDEAYGLTKMDKYQDEELSSFISEFDSGAVFADEDTIIIVAFDEATEDDYASVNLILTDRKYQEGLEEE